MREMKDVVQEEQKRERKNEQIAVQKEAYLQAMREFEEKKAEA